MNVLIIAISVFLYVLFGVILGFALSSHNDVLLGRRPNTKNRLVLFLARPTQNIRGIEKAIFVVGMLLWVPLFVGIIATPIILAAKYATEIEKVVFLLLVPCVLIGKLYGSYRWRKLV